MTALGVNKVYVGDRFREMVSGDIMTVEEFITPENLTQEWAARLSIEGSEIIAHERVKDLVTTGFERLEPR